jgi:putative ABC transport system permease protein
MNLHAAGVNTRRLTGVGAAATLAFAVLVFGCVLAATAGPREALYIRTHALQQALAPVPPLGRAITVSTTWSQFMGSVNEPLTVFSDGQLSNLETQFNRDFSNGVLHLAPVSADWVAMTTGEQSVTSALSGITLPPAINYPVQMQLSYRLPLAGHVRVLAGSLSAPAAKAAKHNFSFYPTINVAVTRQTADKFGLQVGSAVQIVDTSVGSTTTPIKLRVTAIVAESEPASAFWEADPSLAAPQLNVPGNAPDYWTAGALALPDESAAFQQDFGPGYLDVQWVLPMNLGALLGDQAQPMDAWLQRIVTENPQLNGPLSTVAGVVSVSTGVQQVLDSFIYSSDAVDVLLWLLYVSLAVIAAIALLLAARMIVLRRAAELTLRRARGATLRQIGLAAVRGSAIGCVPAGVLAGAVALLLVQVATPPGGWWPGLAVLVFAVGAPAVLAAWQQRLPRSGSARAAVGYARPGQTGRSQPSLGYGALGYSRRNWHRFGGGIRPVVEVTAVLAAIGGILVFRQQGIQPGAAVDLYTSAAPVLVAIPAVIVVLRIYPLILRGLLRGAARSRGATGFLGLARAARAVLTPLLPAYALVLAITVAAFAGMVRDAVARGEVSASWQAAGADVTISNVGPTGVIPAAAQRAFAAVPGVEQTAVVSEWTLTTSNNVEVTALAVDPASYSALVASSRTWPAVDPGLLTGNGIIASRQALAVFGGRKIVTLTTPNAAQLRLRVAGTVSGTPALAAGGAFILMPESMIAHYSYVVPDLMLLNGPRIDTARITELASKLVPEAITTVRSELLAQLTDAPVQHGAFVLLALALAVAAWLGLAVMVLQLALGAADREATLARLATMGLGDGQRARLVLLEVIPAVIAAAVAAVVAALALPRIVAPTLKLSVFTGSSAGVTLVPDVAWIALPIAVLIVLAAVTLTIEIQARRGVVSTLREGDG